MGYLCSSSLLFFLCWNICFPEIYIVVWRRKLHGCGWESILRSGWSFDQRLRSIITYLERWFKCYSGSSFGLGWKIVTFTKFYMLYDGFLMSIINLNRNVRRNLCLKGLISDKKDARERPKWSLNAQQVLRKIMNSIV